jgi:hypothetical protein
MFFQKALPRLIFGIIKLQLMTVVRHSSSFNKYIDSITIRKTIDIQKSSRPTAKECSDYSQYAHSTTFVKNTSEYKFIFVGKITFSH